MMPTKKRRNIDGVPKTLHGPANKKPRTEDPNSDEETLGLLLQPRNNEKSMEFVKTTKDAAKDDAVLQALHNAEKDAKDDGGDHEDDDGGDHEDDENGLTILVKHDGQFLSRMGAPGDTRKERLNNLVKLPGNSPFSLVINPRGIPKCAPIGFDTLKAAKRFIQQREEWIANSKGTDEEHAVVNDDTPPSVQHVDTTQEPSTEGHVDIIASGNTFLTAINVKLYQHQRQVDTVARDVSEANSSMLKKLQHCMNMMVNIDQSQQEQLKEIAALKAKNAELEKMLANQQPKTPKSRWGNAIKSLQLRLNVLEQAQVLEDSGDE